MRLNQYLAQAGIASRRKADAIISSGRVMVNNTKALLGTQVTAADQVTLDGKPVGRTVTSPSYLLYKPRGVVSTTNDPEGRPTVLDYLPRSQARLYPVGRLDFRSEGLILLTSDGALANRLTHPRYQIAKVYRVLIRGHLTPQDQGRIEKGVKLSDGITLPTQIANHQVEGGNMWLEITVREGRHHLIKRLFERFGHTVLRLIRLKMGEYELGDLKVGEYKLAKLTI